VTVPPTDRDPALVLEHAPYVRALARALVFDRQLARDLEQDVLLAALENAPRDRRSLKGWLAALVRNLASKAHRSRARRVERETRAARPEDAVPSPEEILAREDLRRSLLEHLLALDEPVRSAMILRFTEELPPREVARRLRIPVETVRTRVKRGLEELRARLEREPRKGNGVWCLALVKGLKIGPPSIVGAGFKLLGAAIPGVLAVSTLKKVLVASVVVALAATAFLVTRQLEPLHPPAEVQTPLPGPDTTRLNSNEDLGSRGESVQRNAVVAEPAPAPVAASTHSSLLLKLHWHDGTPAAGVTARIYSNGAVDFYADAFDVRTGEDGTYLVESIPPGHVSAYLDRGPEGDCKVAAGERAEIELTIPRGFDLAGTVLERDGRPIAGAQILTDPMGNGWNAFPVERTDAEGRFRIRSIRPGICWVSAQAALHPPSPQHEYIGGAVDIEGVRIVLEPQGGALAGTLYDPRGEPLPHAQVLLGKEQSFEQYKLEDGGSARTPAAQFTSTDEHGGFQFAGAPLGHVEVQARGPGCAPWKGEVEIASGVRAQLVIRMQTGAKLSGSATDASGKPVARAEIQVGAYGFASRYRRADSEGRFHLENLPLGEFVAEAQADGFERAKTTLFGVSGKELEWKAVLGSGLSIRGRLVARDVDFSKWWMYCESNDWEKAPYAQSATPKADGSFEFSGCGDAVHRIRIHAPDASLYPVVTLEARPGTEPLVVTIDTPMLPTCRLRGRLVDESGQPLAGAEFNPVLTGSNVTPLETTDAAGRFDIGPLPPGEYWIRSRAKGYVAHDSEKVKLAAQVNWDFGDLQLKRGGLVVVHLVRANPKPVAIELVRGEASVGWIRLQDGRGRSEPLEPGEYELRPWVDGVRVEAAVAWPRIQLQAGEENTVELELP
jgi:RNA polymerase sigma factor (sigma-70 family)